MSYPWMLVRGASANPSSLKFQSLMNKQSIAENEIFKPERQQPNIISTHTEDWVMVQDPFMFTKLKPKTIHYYAPFEPDYDKLRLWLRFNHIGRTLKDYSFFCNNPTTSIVRFKGNPKLCEGPDDGVKGARIVTRFNSNPNFIDYIYVQNPEDSGIGVTGQTTGFTIYLEFMMESDGEQQLGRDQRLIAHTDTAIGNDGVQVRIGDDRELKFFVRDAGVNYNFISPDNLLQRGLWTKAILKYNPSGHVLSMKVNNTAQTDSADEDPTGTFPDEIDNSVFIGVAGKSAGSGKFIGRYADVRWYRNLIFSGTQESNIWNNGRSISPIEYGSLAVAGYTRFNDTVDAGGYDSTGYDSTGYDTT